MMILKEALDSVIRDDKCLMSEHDIDSMLKCDIVSDTLKEVYQNELDDLSEWNVYHNVSILRRIIDELASKIDEETWKTIDYIGALGGSGAPLAVGLSLKKQKNFIFINDSWGITKAFQPIKPPNAPIKGKKVLVVDSVFRTGLTTYNGVDVLNKEGVSNIILMVVALLPDWADQSLLSLIGNIDFYYMFVWNKNVESAAIKSGLIMKK